MAAQLPDDHPALMAQQASGLPDGAIELHLCPPDPRDEDARLAAIAAGWTQFATAEEGS